MLETLESQNTVSGKSRLRDNMYQRDVILVLRTFLGTEKNVWHMGSL